MKKTWTILLLPVLFLAQCTKTKLDSSIVPPGGVNQSNSSVRIYNLFGFNMDVSVNNIPLTPYGSASSGNTYGQAIFGGGYFKDGASFTVPNGLLDKQSRIHLVLYPNIPVRQGTAPDNLLQPIDTILTNDPLNPGDYYILSSGHFLAIPRSLAVPQVASHFKIRIINLGAGTDPNNITGPVTLTYADGSTVDPVLTGIAPGVTSAYAELPYGAYEFKLFIAGGGQIDITKQLSIMTNLPNNATAGPKPNWFGYYQPGSPVYLQDKRFSPSKVYEPGGTYNLFVSQNIGQYVDAYGGNEFIPLNSFRILTENSPATNITFARIQGVNALPAAGDVTFKVDGQTLGTAMAFGAHSDFGIFIQGTHVVEADDAQGNMLAQKTINLYANDNITAWLYTNGQTSGICFSANDMSVVNSNVQLQCRFLNLTTNVPFASFLSQSPGGGPFTEANDTLGRPAIGYDPYFNGPPYYNFNLTPGVGNGGGGDSINVQLGQMSYYLGQIQGTNQIVNGPNPFVAIYAFQSSPAVVPGTYLSDVAAISPASFIANPALYSAQSTQPPGEPGVYTIALIGTEGDSTDAFYPRMLVLKHTK